MINPKKIIDIDDQYRLVSDTNNITLEKNVSVDKPKLTRGRCTNNISDNWKEIGHYSTMLGALFRYSRETLRDAEDIEDLISRMSTLEDMFDDALYRFGKKEDRLKKIEKNLNRLMKVNKLIK